MTAAQIQPTADGLRLEGEVTYLNADELSGAGIALLKSRHGPDPARVDLAAVVDPGTIVVALLLSWYRELQPRGVQLALANVPGPLRRILQFTGVMKVLEADSNGDGR